MHEKLRQASAAELQLWMWSAFIFGIGLGASTANYLRGYGLWILVVSGGAHVYMMFRIYSRK